MEIKHFIGLNVNGYTIVVINAREVYGHDDTLPYNAEFEIRYNGNVLVSGRAWNDGWGGMSCYQTNEHNGLVEKINEYAKEHIKYNYYGHEFSLDFIDIIDHLVDLSLDGKSPNCGKTFSERALINYLNKQ